MRRRHRKESLAVRDLARRCRIEVAVYKATHFRVSLSRKTLLRLQIAGILSQYEVCRIREYLDRALNHKPR